jgi:hypothetical protein
MSRYNPGDDVVILRRFVHLYPARRGTILSVDASPAREMFDQYLVQFHNLSSATIFDFELIKDASRFDLVSTTVAFDSSTGNTSPGLRGGSSGRQILLRSSPMDVHIRIETCPVGSRLTGQLLRSQAQAFVQNAEVRLWQDEMPIDVMTTNNLGEFRFDRVPSAATTIEVYFQEGRLSATVSI